MLRNYRKNQKESIHGMNSEGAAQKFVDNSSKNDCINSKRIKKTKMRDFILRMQRDTGFICEI